MSDLARPGATSSAMAAAVAEPLAKARPWSTTLERRRPRRSSRGRVGLPVRAYSQPPRRPADAVLGERARLVDGRRDRARQLRRAPGPRGRPGCRVQPCRGLVTAPCYTAAIGGGVRPTTRMVRPTRIETIATAGTRRPSPTARSRAPRTGAQPLMSHPHGHRHRRRQRRRDHRAAHRGGRPGGRRARRHRRGAAAGQGARPGRGGARSLGHDCTVTGTNDYADTAGSDIVVVTSGLARQPGMSRDDLLAKNAGIVARRSSAQAAAVSPDAILIIVTNPLDAMCHVALEASAASRRERVIGMAGVLDSARFRTFIAAGAGRLRHQHARLRAGRPRRHDGAAAALLARSAACPSRSCCPPSASRRSSSAPATAARRSWRCSRPAAPSTRRPRRVYQMVDAILDDRHAILPCAAYSTGQYGVDGLFVGVPVQLGRSRHRGDHRRSS